MTYSTSRTALASALLLCAANASADTLHTSAATPSFTFARDAAVSISGQEPQRRASSQALLQASSLTPPDVYGLTTMASSWYKSANDIAMSVFKWNGTARGAGVIIGIVDSGIDLDHPEFAGRVLTGNCFGGWSAICTAAGAMQGGDPGIYSAQLTHGTHVAGIAAGATVGLANQAKILPVKVCDTYSSSCPGNADSAIVWASTHGAKVINLSLGGSGLYASDINAAATAIKNGALLVVAAGNGGTSHPVSGFLGGAALKDGVRGGMIVVGATGVNNVLASYSQTPGSTCELHSTTNYCMRDYYVVAPGQGIRSSVGGGKYANMSGTSMAAPYVTGLAALIKGQWSSLTPYQVADIILKTADDLGAVGPDNVYGRGAADVAAAMSPVGGAAVITTTAGKTVSSATGPNGALTTTSVGVLSAPLAQSALLKNVVVVDTYGRDFSADFTKLAQTPGMSLAGMMSDPFRSVSPFAISEDGAVGRVSVSGTIVAARAPRELGVNAALDGESLKSTEHLAASFAPSRVLSLDFGRNLNMSGYFNAYDLRSMPGSENVFLSASALNSPYASLVNGGTFSGASISPVDGVKLRFGYAVGQNERFSSPATGTSPNSYISADAPASLPHGNAHSVLANLSWDFANWGGIGVTASQSTERNAVLGGFTSGAFAAADLAHTGSVGISARIGLGEGWTTTLAWNEGITRLDLAGNGLITNADPLRSRAYGLALTKANLFGDDAFGVALTRPLHIYGGNATLHAATSVDANQNLIFSDERLSLAAPRPETSLEFGYAARFYGGALSIQTSTAYQLDVGGRPGRDAVTFMSRAALRF